MKNDTGDHSIAPKLYANEIAAPCYTCRCLCGLSTVAEDDNGLGGGISLHDGYGRTPGCQILADQAISRYGVDVCQRVARPRYFGDGQGSNGHDDQ